LASKAGNIRGIRVLDPLYGRAVSDNMKQEEWSDVDKLLLYVRFGSVIHNFSCELIAISRIPLVIQLSETWPLSD
jgi:hypothetical protein